MKEKLKKLSKNKRARKYFWIGVSVLCLITAWWILSATYFVYTDVLPSPPEVLRLSWSLAGTLSFWISIFSTLWRVALAFLFSFVFGFVLAILAAYKNAFRDFVSPIVTVLRALPTLGAVFFLLIFIVSFNTVAIVIAFLMVFPFVYENLYYAVKETDVELLQMARVHKIPFSRQVAKIYGLHMMPYIFSNFIAGIGMSLKVVIAAEIITLSPLGLSLGNQIARSANEAGGYLFMWLFVAVMLSFALEGVIRLIGWFCMPWKRVG